MRISTSLWSVACGGAFALLTPLLGVSCNGSSPPSGPCQNGTIDLIDCEPDDAGVVHEIFTDEACDGLDTAEQRAAVMHSDVQAPAFDAPTEGQIMPRAAPFTFRWHDGAFAVFDPPAIHLRSPTWTDDLSRWQTLLPEAQAHCTPFGGVAFAINFSAANGQVLLRAETASLSYTPSANAWARLLAASGVIAVNVEVARFSDNVVTEGPYDRVTPVHVTMGP